MKTATPTGNTALRTEIFQRIHDSEAGAISFAEFMEAALYHPDWGYYHDPGSRKIGRTGDFFTSVSVGDCFGFLLGWELERRWREELESPDSLTIIEQGAHDGQLAMDIVGGLAKRGSELADKIRYVIIEPSISRGRLLREHFAESEPQLEVKVVASAEEIREPCGVFLCNELMDAFPVHRVRFDGGIWKELCVGREGDEFEWRVREIDEDSELRRECGRIGDDFPEGYTTEINLALRDWIRSVAPIFDRGFWWMIDYGFEEDEYFASHRTDGTLQCYQNHRVSENPFEFPGETDITAHVDFSRLFRTAKEAGLKKLAYSDQHEFLIRAATPWLTAMERDGTSQEPENRKRLRQFQTLTHPGMMGRVFKVAEFSRGL